MSYLSFGVKRSFETRRFAFDFLSSLSPSETLSTPSISLSVLAGEDLFPNALLSGAAAVAGSAIQQDLMGGVDGVIYLVRCQAQTSLGQSLSLLGILAVSDEPPL